MNRELAEAQAVLRAVVGHINGVLPMCADEFLGSDLWARIQSVLGESDEDEDDESDEDEDDE